MTQEALKAQIQSDMKEAMKAKDAARLGTIRLLMAAIKQIEIDSQKTLDDEGIIGVLNKMIKQRNESIKQFEAADRPALAEKEKAEIAVLEKYLPEPLSDKEVEEIIEEAIRTSGATEMKDMGKVMGLLKAKLHGRADMSLVSQKIKAKLS